MKDRSWALRIWVLVAMLAVALANFTIFGLTHPRTWTDAAQYNAYASSLVSGHGYTTDGVTFNVRREPGYPFFVAILYKIFGNGNLLAVCFIQALLLGVLGFILYEPFSMAGHPRLGIAAGVLSSGLPSYGFYSNELLTELLFAFFLAVVFYICVKIALDMNAGWPWYALLGLASGYAALVRFQFIFFLPFIFLVLVLWKRMYQREMLRNITVSLVLMLCLIVPWVAYVHAKTGQFAVTDGRQEEFLYSRSVRAQLSYGELTRYMREWIERSLSGGTGGTAFLYQYEFKHLATEYYTKATDPASARAVQREAIKNIITHPGTYLYSCLLETIKLLYIEHDYTDSLNRYFRAAMYVFIYGFCAFGAWFVLHGKGSLRTIGLMAAAMIGYNILVLAPIADIVSRLNTPWLMFYIIIGLAGTGIMLSDRVKKLSAEIA